VVNPQTMAEVDVVQQDTLALVAAFVGGTRLIDNRPLQER